MNLASRISVTVAVAQLAESWIVIPVVVGSSPTSHPILIKSITLLAGVAKLVDAPDLGSGAFGVRVRVSSPAPLKQRLKNFIVLFLTKKVFEFVLVSRF